MRLVVCLEGSVAGTLEATGSRTHFTYSDLWLNRNGTYPLSQSLPLRPGPHTGAPTINFLWGLLPDNEPARGDRCAFEKLLTAVRPRANRPSMRLAPLYDIASAWPYPRRIPPQKMKLAMRIGRHYGVRQIQPRHFQELAKSCRYPADTMIAILKQLSEQLPEEGLAVLKEVQARGMERDVLVKLLDGLAAQCKITLRNLDDAQRSAQH